MEVPMPTRQPGGLVVVGIKIFRQNQASFQVEVRAPAVDAGSSIAQHPQFMTPLHLRPHHYRNGAQMSIETVKNTGRPYGMENYHIVPVITSLWRSCDVGYSAIRYGLNDILRFPIPIPR